MAMTETERMAFAGEQDASEAAMSVGTTAAGLALVVLGILALDKIEPMLLVSIAVIVGGVLLVAESACLTQQLASALASKPGHNLKASELASGLSAGVLGGTIGVVLGILAILNVVPETLVAVAVIVFGAAVMFEFAARSQVRALRMTTAETPEQSARLALAAASSTSTAAMFAAVGLITLGILALAGVANGVLVAVALLGLGAYVLLESAAVVGHITHLIG
jgi:hypothetical protein